MDINTYLELKSKIDQEYEISKKEKLNYPYNYWEGMLFGIERIEQLIDKIYQNSNKNDIDFTD